MPIPCRVCSSLARPEIDARLCQHVVNVAELAREYGVSWKSMKQHREQHVPTFLRVYGAAQDLPSLGELHAEALRVYMTTLDELGRAQAGVLIDIDSGGTEHRAVSHTAIARLLDGARKSVDQLARLAADAGSADDRPVGMVDGALTERIRVQLEARDGAGHTPVPEATTHALGTAHVPTHADLVDQLGGVASGVAHEGGGRAVGRAGVPAPPQIPLDAAMANETLPVQTGHILPPTATARQAVIDNLRTLEQHQSDERVVFTVRNPSSPLSLAASQEERQASGFPDIEVTVEDLRSSSPRVDELLAIEGSGRTAEQLIATVPPLPYLPPQPQS